MLARAIKTSKKTSTHIVNIFFEYCLFSYSIPMYFLTENGTHFVINFFATMCSLLGVKPLTTAAYRIQTNDRAERFNKTIYVRLRHYFVEHQKNWSTVVQPLKTAYNRSIQRSTNQTPFSLVLRRQPPGPILLKSKDAIPSNTHGKNSRKSPMNS